jgi:hypothetical protein
MLGALPRTKPTAAAIRVGDRINQRESIMPNTTLCIGGFGTRRSPFFECYAMPESEFGVGNGRLFPWHIGDSATDDYWSLRRKAAQFDIPEMPLEVTGPDAANNTARATHRFVCCRLLIGVPSGTGRLAALRRIRELLVRRRS